MVKHVRDGVSEIACDLVVNKEPIDSNLRMYMLLLDFESLHFEPFQFLSIVCSILCNSNPGLRVVVSISLWHIYSVFIVPLVYTKKIM